MTLASGSRLGAYEIRGPLGAGGMGEVYRARDTRLGREIAIKVLPAEVSADPDRRQRFEQEARSATALNHPNILTIYDIGVSEGTTWMAMELVEGKTLRDVIAAESLSIRKVLDYAVQIADGLAKAHAAGIVHRDLKPENVMISKDGFVKILDFGLAKLTQPSGREGSELPTAIEAATQPGTVMGTAGYMSPEQASGQPVDFRSDQFSLGSILYEMAAGKRAFQGKTGAETLVAIIREEPEPIGQVNPKAPAPVRWIIERCLAKDPEERYASTKDLARDLAAARGHLSEASASGGVAAAEPVPAKRRGWLLPAAAALLAGAALGALGRGLLPSRTPALPRFQRLTYQRGTITSARFAPDGQTILYGAAIEGRPMEVFSTVAEGHVSRSLSLPTSDVLAVSSTGELALSLNRHFTIGFQTIGTLARAPLAGGAPREILENVQDADWSPDGKEMAVSHYVGGRCKLEYPIGHVLYEASGWASSVRVSPDGRLVAFVDHPQLGDSDGTIRVVDRDGKTRLTGAGATRGLAWSPAGDEIWSSSPLRVTSLSSGKTRSPWALLGEQDSIYDISRTGKVLFSRSATRREIIVSASGGPEKNLTWLNWSFPVDFSRDGKLVLFDEQQIEPTGIFVRKVDGSPAIQLGEGKSFEFSPDGQWALSTPKIGTPDLVLLPTGAGLPRKISLPGIACQWAKFFLDGQRILVLGNEPGRAPRLFVADLSGSKPRAITPEGVVILNQNPFSPDGKSIVAIGPDRRIAIYPTEPGEPRPVPGLSADDYAQRFAADGRSIYVYNIASHPGVVDLVDIQTGKRTPWKEFHPPDPAGVIQIAPFLVTSDGKSYAYSYRRMLDDLYVVTGLR
ncbi:MAG TPA: protein kinase [Thermoanaerobaculia bacterium]|nr:protein kinase [Thermoanaerobaculia bacterium]